MLMGGLNILLLLCTNALFSLLITCTAVDTIAANQAVRDGETVVSAGGTFAMGFFSPGSSRNRYLGIWYKKIPTGSVVWVANRDVPLTDTSGMLKVNNEGSLLLLDGAGRVIWSTKSSRAVTNPVAQLLDNGNLVVRDKSVEDLQNLIWESFDYPGDTFLAEMKFGKDLVMGTEWHLTSWKSVDDPSQGEYAVRVDPNGFPQVFLMKGPLLQSRLGPRSGSAFSGTRSFNHNPIYTYEFVFTKREIYFSYKLTNQTYYVSKMILAPDGSFRRLVWMVSTQQWVLYSDLITDNCDRYGLCGTYGSCNIDRFPLCQCLKGFEPKLQPKEWNAANWSSGCQRRTELDCQNAEGFQKLSSVKLPDTRHAWFNKSMNLWDCEMACKKNCSCTAYANLNIEETSIFSGGGTGCLLWFGDLIDIRDYSENQDLYIRVAASELSDLTVTQSGTSRKKGVITVTLSISVGVVLLGFTAAMYSLRKKRSRVRSKGQAFSQDYKDDQSQKEDLELTFFSFSAIAKASNNFSEDNKLGQGGFGPVYKGVLEEGKEIAIKRLSKTSRQGLDEFKNEVVCISKLQHRNLVKLLGYSIKTDELMLIYEFMPNKSLDKFIFDETKSSLLDWPTRFCIIQGIARGLLYLHQDSRLRVIHRDLKAGNILLDYDMNPKISDFGLARRFRGCETEANTNTVVGTYGYISPEYAVNGIFSVKSDVFSFGVLVLEIVSGKKNRGFSHQDRHDNLLGHAWRLFNEGKSLELMDTSLRGSCHVPEVLRSIHVSLLCVQQHKEDRPSMSSVVLMLGSEAALPPPKQPGFFTDQSVSEVKSHMSLSANKVTVTVLEAR